MEAITTRLRTHALVNLTRAPILATTLWLMPAPLIAAETIDIAIGHQSMCTDTDRKSVV